MPPTEPVPPSEVKVLESLIMIRNRLTVLKKNSSYQSNDIFNLYIQLNSEVSELLDIRKQQDRESAEYINRVDDVIDDVYQLLSLFWMALGKNLESPATYVQLISIEQCLEHLIEFGIYTMEELEPFDERIEGLGLIIEEERNFKSPMLNDKPSVLTALVQKKLCHCRSLLDQLKKNWSDMSDYLLPIQTKLVDLRRQLAILVARGNTEIDKVKEIRKELREIDALRVDGRFQASDGTLPKGQAQVGGLLEECFDEVESLLSSQTEVSENLKPIFDQLMQMKDHLSKLYITRRWTMREPDLWAFQVQLNEIDNLRKKGKFHDDEGKPLKGQGLLHFLLQKCYRFMYRLLASSEPVAEALAPVHSQLYTLRKCLVEVKTLGGPFAVRELYPYQIKLASIDNMRVDGKFLDENGQVPEGQGVVMALLNECYDILFELKDLIEE